MSTLAASGIATVGTCTSKGMLVIAFIVQITRECPAARAGMRRAVCRDDGCGMCANVRLWANVGCRSSDRAVRLWTGGLARVE